MPETDVLITNITVSIFLEVWYSKLTKFDVICLLHYHFDKQGKISKKRVLRMHLIALYFLSAIIASQAFFEMDNLDSTSED